MKRLEEASDEELRGNALDDPGLFLNMDDDDDDEIVLAAQFSLPKVGEVENHMHVPVQQQTSQQLSSSTLTSSLHSRLSTMGVPKLDVVALNDPPSMAAARMQPGYGQPGGPMTYARDGGGVEHLNGAAAPYHGAAGNAGSPHNICTSPNMATMNVYTSIAAPPLSAKQLPFREFLNQKSVPPYIESEESTGIFVGQLPSSYLEDDIVALLKALGHEQGHVVEVRDVKCHNRDRTCAFIMINAGALNAVLDFTKRVLCDINCVWVVDHSQAAQLPFFIQQMPREQLRGVPKAALVLEKLTPQTKPRHQNHQGPGGVANSPMGGGGYVVTANAAPTSLSPMSMGSHPLYGQAAQMNGAAGPVGYVDVSAYNPNSPFRGGNMVAASALLNSNGAGQPMSVNGNNGLPQFFGTGTFQSSPPSGHLFPPSGMNSNSGSLYSMPIPSTGGAIASLEAANQRMIAASRSRSKSQSGLLSGGAVSPSNTAGMSNAGLATLDSQGPLPTAVQLTPVLQQEHCSCGSLLLLSQYPRRGACAKCQSVISSQEVGYWCPKGHLAVCIMCALQTSVSADRSNGVR